ncbi:MAG: 2-oxoacid:acceptor oxidoreductase subunit alpha [Candidatus Thermoplasmatota archaeon]|uniref:2-oxoglutarate synthase subunit KorA n=1 Tax=Candidatus Sysuiplasma superficiale TaxID=2823368 RepID=A0A8J7YJ90_9ARCH|nr:2-oxoacid:acceptor oxidoreductase subunit alpha [Candidatus Sysuiplasma superficiale]MCL4346998.1 2-oxoacid:acceptor oxidoreductase subunit alpha [Candidatus Thermoplasmatota archaeon]
MDITIRLGAAAGDGIQSAGEIVTRMLSRSGQYVVTYNGNQSLIRGGHVWFHIHAGNWRVTSLGYGIDYLLALTQIAYDEHAGRINRGGAVIYDPKFVKAGAVPEGVTKIPLPLTEIALKYDKRPLMKNTVGIGAIGGILNIDRKILEEVIREQFASKSREVIEGNVKAALEGYEKTEEDFVPTRKLEFDYSIRRRFAHADFALAAGAVSAGCRFYAAYPMSPASPILHYMAYNAKKMGISVLLAEDEISAIGATIGAAFAGARAMCGTSGGGFALMQEAFGMASMNETPIVVVDVMRAGPSTGLPTKTAQGDLNMMLGISQDDFPRVIIAPRNPEETFNTMPRAFNLAERYQVPVIILLDFGIGDGGYATVENLNFDVEIDRGKLISEVPKDGSVWFRRYELTEDNISPRVLPGTPNGMFVAKTDEHDEYGHDLSDVEAGLSHAVDLRVRMMNKRMGKLQGIAEQMNLPEINGPEDAEISIVCWGSTSNPVREALRKLWSEGVSVNSIEFTDLFPLKWKEVASILRRSKRLVDVEGNYSGQMAGLIARETGIVIEDRFLSYSGEPIEPGDILQKIREMTKTKMVMN